MCSLLTLLTVFYSMQCALGRDVDLEGLVNWLMPTRLHLKGEEIATDIPTIGKQVPITIEAMQIGLANTGFNFEYDKGRSQHEGAAFIITLEEMVATLNPDTQKPVNLTVNGCFYDLSGSLTLKKVYIEVPHSNTNCEYENAVFVVKSVQNNIDIKAKDFCPKANSMINIADHIPFWAALPYIEKIGEQITVQQLNEMEIVIGDMAFKLCTDFTSTELRFVLELVD
eukprot:112037_1